MVKLSKKMFVFLTIFLQISMFTTEEVPSFRVIAPQNLCKYNEDDSSPKQPDGVTLTFQPKDGFKLSYKFKVFFKIIGPEPLSQRETLLVWKAVRALEQRLNSRERLQIMKNNMVMVKKSEVVPGVSYVFHIVGITDAGESSREQILTIDYADGVLQNNNVPEGINFLLIGSEEIVSNIEYNVVAKASFCKPKEDYYIEWKLTDLEENYQFIENTISTTLLLPPNALNSERKTSIEASVKENSSNKLLAKDVIWVEVLNKGFQAMIIPSAVRIGEGSYLTFRLFLHNFDHVQQIIINWSLEDAASRIALETKDKDQKYNKVFFEKAGSFQVVAQVKINDIATKVKADVEVINSVFINFEFQNIPNLNPASYEEFKFSVLVLNMVADCEASWLSAQEEGFKFIASGMLEKEHFGYTKVSDIEKYFLEEIIDFSNATVSREITLYIPSTYSKAGVMWTGLERDSMYKFRLDVTCPKSFSENSKKTKDEDEPWTSVVTSYFTVDIHTNAPPRADKVLIDPLQGVALKTMFNINSQEAKDLLLDTPVSYELFITIENFFKLTFGKYFQFKAWEIVLPYTSLPSEINVQICDIRQACSKIKNDTQILLVFEELTEQDYRAYEAKVSGNFMRTDYQDAFNYLIMTAVTLKNGKSLYYEKWLNFILVHVSKEVDKLLEEAEKKMFISSESKLTFVVNCKAILDYTQQMTKEMLKNLLDILENIMEYTDSKNSIDNQVRLRRSKRVKRIVNYSHELYTKTQLALLEDLLQSSQYSSEAIEDFMQRITNLAKRICLNKNIDSETLKSSLVSLTLRKIHGDFLQEHITQFDEVGFEKVILQLKNINKNNINSDTNYCLTIKTYNIGGNSQHDKTFIEYNIYEILSNRQLEELKISDLKHTSSNVQLDIYSSKQQHNRCLMKNYLTATWSAEPCKSRRMDKFLRCSCFQTGFLKTDQIVLPHTTTKPIITNDILATAVSSLPIFNSLNSTSTSTTTTALPTTSKFQTNNDLQANPTFSTRSNIKSIQKASPLTYIIPLIFVMLLLLLSVLYMIHRRRSKMTSKKTSSVPTTMILELRKPASGIRYANIYDDHLLSGNF